MKRRSLVNRAILRYLNRRDFLQQELEEVRIFLEDKNKKNQNLEYFRALNRARSLETEIEKINKKISALRALKTL